MRRLTENQVVMVTPPPDSRVTGFAAHVIAVDSSQARLHPVRAVDVLWLPERLPGVMMLYEFEGQKIGLKGALRVGTSPQDIRFNVTDGVCLMPRRSTRVRVCLPVTMCPVDPDGRPIGEAIRVQTSDVGPDGLLLERDVRLPVGGLMSARFELPEDVEPVCGTVRVIEQEENGSVVVQFLRFPARDRARMRSFVAERFRSRLVRSTHEEDADVDSLL